MAIVPLSRAGWTITASSTYDTPYAAAKAIDGNTGSFWHSGEGYPHDLTVDMGTAQTFSAVEFVPRSDGTRTDPAQVEVYVSDDGTGWGSPVASATWASTSATQSLTFTAVTKRWFRFRGVTGANNAFLACTELYAGTPAPAAVRVTQAAVETLTGAAAATPVRVTQAAVETLTGIAGTAARVTQVAVESLAGTAVAARVTQAAVEVLAGTGTVPPAEAAFTVEPEPLVRWRADVPAEGFLVEASPRVFWDGLADDPNARFLVHTAPVVRWITGAGTAGTDCISGDGTVPPPDEDPPESLEENYVF